VGRQDWSLRFFPSDVILTDNVFFGTPMLLESRRERPKIAASGHYAAEFVQCED